MFTTENSLGGLPIRQNPILRPTEVARIRGRSRSAHYADINAGLFVKPVSIGLRAVGTPAREVAILNEARIAGKSDEAIRALVLTLEAARKNANRQAPQTEGA